MGNIYQTGDLVVHPQHGGCVVLAVGTQQFRGVSAQYYTLTPHSDETDTTLYVPVEGSEKLGIRKVISSRQADKVLHYYTDVQTEWIADHKKRKASYDVIMRTGTLSELAKMVKELLVQTISGKLNNAEKELLPRASKKLFSELALAKGMAFEQIYLMAQSAVGA